MRAVVLSMLFAVACSGGGDDDTELEAPDISGRYNLSLAGTTGCDGQSSLLADWANGPLTVSGDPNALTFDFGDGISMVGTVSATASFQFGDLITIDAWELSVYASGNAFEEDGRWVLAGTIWAEADDDDIQSNNCTIEGPFEAYQLAQ